MGSTCDCCVTVDKQLMIVCGVLYVWLFEMRRGGSMSVEMIGGLKNCEGDQQIVY